MELFKHMVSFRKIDPEIGHNDHLPSVYLDVELKNTQLSLINPTANDVTKR